MKYKYKILVLFSLLVSMYATSQITLNACHSLLEDQDYVFNNIDTDATGRNIFETNPIDGNQPCGGIGSCEFQIAWNDSNNRWEIYADDGNGTFTSKFVLYYNNENTLPNPPSILSVWVEETVITQSLCGSILKLEGEVQDPDTEPPVLSGIPTEPIISDSESGFCGASIDFPAFTATDNSSGEVSIITDPLSGSFFQVGNTTVTVTATDLSGNSTIESFEVIVNKPIAVPNIESLPDITEECETTLIAPTAKNDCGDEFTATSDVIFPITYQGTTIITWSYDDGTGNAISQQQNVIIDDNIAPIPDLAVLPDLEGQKSVDKPIIDYTASDNCRGIITATTSNNFPIKKKGLTIITWIYDDGNGNATIQTQNVIINKISSKEIKVIHYPNPFKESITFSFELPYGANFKVIIYSQLGNLVSELTSGDFVDNKFNVVWNANSFKDDVYFYKLLTNGLEVGKGTIIKNANSGK